MDVSADANRSKHVVIRVTDSEREKLELAAERARCRLSDLVRRGALGLADALNPEGTLNDGH
ncbi:MAG TPA: hypothetical protein VLV45_03325 [Gemmatimonadales bacterium]|nr:hypothetical protein [Gemmatimonadales bacterium]